jgi:hypothetical protein
LRSRAEKNIGLLVESFHFSLRLRPVDAATCRGMNPYSFAKRARLRFVRHLSPVKAEENLKSKLLRIFTEKNKDVKGLRLSVPDYRVHD